MEGFKITISPELRMPPEKVIETSFLLSFRCLFGLDGYAYTGERKQIGDYYSYPVLCSQPAFRCTKCGEYDYGEVGGPSYEFCKNECPLEEEKENG